MAFVAVGMCEANVSPTIFGCSSSCCSAGPVDGETYEAVFNMEGVKGTITFVANDVGIGTQVSMADFLPSGYNLIKIKAFPVLFGKTEDATSACSNLGKDIEYLFSSAGSNSKYFYDLGKKKYLNRAVAISGHGMPTICANVLPKSLKTDTYRAKLVGSAGGEIWYRSINSEVYLFGSIYYTSPNSGENVGLIQVFSQNVQDTYSTRCSNLRNPLATISFANLYSSTTKDGRFARYLPSMDINAKSIAFVKPDGMIVACGDLVLLQEESATAYFNWNNVHGTIKLKQLSPFDKTTVQVQLNGLDRRASGYHVHKFPVPQRLTNTENRCSAALVSGHFNPYGIVVSNSPAAGTGTNDQYEIGDLSGKFGTLDSLRSVIDRAYEDWNLPLFGPNSVIGRSIVIHERGGARWVCATIEPDYDITVGLATFKTPAYGHIYMMQRKDSPDSDTSVFVDVANHNTIPSNNHRWNLNVNKVSKDQLTAADRCNSTGGVYNPFLIKDNVGNSNCAAAHPYLCELGAVSSKLTTINIAARLRVEDSKSFFTDFYLPLSGPYSVLQRSLTIQDANRGIGHYACANVIPLHPVLTQSGSWKGGPGDFGVLAMQQTTEFSTTKYIDALVGVSRNMVNIHNTQISSTANTRIACITTSVGSQYNPFAQSPPRIKILTTTHDKYAVGDLSRKHPQVTGENRATTTKMDSNLPLFTRLSAADKSVVIYQPNSVRRWRCSNLLMQPSTLLTGGTPGHVITATAVFQNKISGTVKLRQVVYEDWGMSPTSIEVDVTTNPLSPQHKWHIHVHPVKYEGDCSTAKGHYNPYDAPITEEFYSTECSITNPLACEAGDLSKKQGRHDIGGGKKTYVDVDIPLITDVTVLGRSIMFHDPNGGAPRFTCANIVPDSNTYTLAFSSKTQFKRSDFIKTISRGLNIAESRVVIVHNTNIPVTKGECSRVMVYIVGGTIEVTNLLQGALPGIGKYAPTFECQSEEGATIMAQTSEVVDNTACSPLCQYYVQLGMCANTAIHPSVWSCPVSCCAHIRQECTPICKRYVELGMCRDPALPPSRWSCSADCCVCKDASNCMQTLRTLRKCTYACKKTCRFCVPGFVSPLFFDGDENA